MIIRNLFTQILTEFYEIEYCFDLATHLFIQVYILYEL